MVKCCKILLNLQFERSDVVYNGRTGWSEKSIASKNRQACRYDWPLHSLGQYGAALANAVSKFMSHELAPHGLNNLAMIRLFLARSGRSQS